MSGENATPEFNDFTDSQLSDELLEGLQENQREFLVAYAGTALNVKRACETANISRTTFYHWMNTSNTFALAVHDLKEGLKDDVESVMVKMIATGNVPLLIHFSKTKMKERGYIEGAPQEVDDYESGFMKSLIEGLKKHK